MSIQRTFAVAGAKGGVGKTTTSINLAAGFAEAGTSAVVAELDLAMANAVDFLDLDLDIYGDPTLHDVFAGRTPVMDAVYEAPGGIHVLPSGVDLDGFAETSTDHLGAAVERLESAFEVVVLDTGAGLSRETLVPLGLADEVLLMSTPRVASVRDTEKTMQLTERVGGRVGGIVFARSGTGRAPDVDRIAEFLSVDLLGHVPEDEAVPAAQDAGEPVVSRYPDAPAAKAYRGIAAELADRPATPRARQSRGGEQRVEGMERRSAELGAGARTGEPDGSSAEAEDAPESLGARVKAAVRDAVPAGVFSV